MNKSEKNTIISQRSNANAEFNQQALERNYAKYEC